MGVRAFLRDRGRAQQFGIHTAVDLRERILDFLWIKFRNDRRPLCLAGCVGKCELRFRGGAHPGRVRSARREERTTDDKNECVGAPFSHTERLLSSRSPASASGFSHKNANFFGAAKLRLVRDSETVISVEAPGRIEVLGNHNDYNEGLVLGVAIDRVVRIRGSARTDGRILLRAPACPSLEVALADLKPQGRELRWANYPLGVVSEFADRGVPMAGFSAEIDSNVPVGAGLGSSGALGVAMAFFLLKLSQYDLAPLEIAKVCQRAEHRFAGVESG